MFQAAEGAKLYLFLIFFTIFFTSCAPRMKIYPIPTDVGLTAGDEAKIPLHAGLHINNQLSTLKVLRIFGPYDEVIAGGQYFFIGDAFVNNSEVMAKAIFTQASMIASVESQDQSRQKYDVIVSPQLIKAEDHYSIPECAKCYRVGLIIKWNIVAPDGKEIYVTTIKTEEIVKKSFMTPEGDVNAFKQVLRNHFEKVREDIYQGGWWKAYIKRKER